MDDFSDLTIIIPTLNEVRNIPKLVPLLLKSYRNASIIVADDGSTDGTGAAVRWIARSDNKVKLLDRGARTVHGLTASVLDAALITKTEKIVVMDGDMQHPIDKVGSMAKMLDRFTLVVGVRTKVKNWGIQRRIISKCMSSFVYSYFRLRGLPTTSDMMSGFFGMRTGTFKSIIKRDRKGFVEPGYKVLLDILRVVGSDVRMCEVRYGTFHERAHGKSKLSALGINHASDTLKSIFR